MAAKGLPRAKRWVFSKRELLGQLAAVDDDRSRSERTRKMEVAFRDKIAHHVSSLPGEAAKFEKFFTSPYVILMHAYKNNYRRIAEIEHDILPAKLFSSMETSAGRAVEQVTLPFYGWETVPSAMHTPYSAIDGKCLRGDTLLLATLKSGPRCLNDEMSENFADTILNYAAKWADDAGVKKIGFTYGVLYGTEKISNKKDWHILRKLSEKVGERYLTRTPEDRWSCQYVTNGIEVTTTVRIGRCWWEFLGGDLCLAELAAALVRACVEPGDADPEEHVYTISDLHDIVALEGVAKDYNPALLQRSQLPWYFFFMRHFCDVLSA